jgi:hypothetical protein
MNNYFSKKKGNNNMIFQQLPVGSDENYNIEVRVTEQSDMAYVNYFLSKLFTPREIIVPSSWEGHVPFFYCLLYYTKPRRFVELGTYYGNSFFAACQISKMMDPSMDCIAIDSWIGDKHAGLFDKKVYEQFKRTLEYQYPKARHIRKLFSEAAVLFEEKSIDILHIDGLHTYEAVSEDYHTWLPKMSNRGIILFHDTHEKSGDFGVWKLWGELKTQYPSFEFGHSHGLGVLLVGSNPSRDIKKLFELFAYPDYQNLFDFIFTNKGLGLDSNINEKNNLSIFFDSYTWRTGRVITWLPRTIIKKLQLLFQ